MSKVCDVEVGSNRSVVGGLEPHAWGPEKIHVLSVGSVDCGSLVHDALLHGPSFHLTIATDCKQLWTIPRQESLQIVILHSTLTAFELEDVSRFIRQRWPLARILVLRSGEGFLDDALYDDRLAPTVAPDVLIAEIERSLGLGMCGALEKRACE